MLPGAAHAWADALREIVDVTPPSAQYVQYHDALLRHLLAEQASATAGWVFPS